MSEGFGKRVAAGLRWSTLDAIGGQAIRFAVTVVLTRLVAPESFGLLAMALLFTQLASLLGDLGFGPALVQRREIDRRHIRTAFTCTTAVGVVLAGVVASASPLIASFFDAEQLQSVVMAVAVVFALRGISGVPKDLLRRAMRFDTLATASLVAITVSGVVGIAVAAAGGGVWALVLQVVIENALLAAIICGSALWARVWSPALGFSKVAFKDIAGFGAFVSGTRLAHYGVTNVDNLVVGKVLGTGQLGLYNLAYRVMLAPILKVADVVANVTGPALARLQDEPQRLAEAYRRSVRSIALACLPVSVGTAVAAPVLVPAVFGNDWVAAVTVVQILALNGIRLALSRMNGVVLEAVGKPQRDLYVLTGLLAAYSVAFIVGVRWDIAGVAWAYTLVGYAFFPLECWLVHRALSASPMQTARTLTPVMAASAVMAVVSWLTLHFLLPASSDAVRSVMVVTVATLTYVAGLKVLAPRLLQDTARQLMGKQIN